ncbi:Dihydroxyacetone synthase [Tulasnella sp. JGI-2019a]|nr:Dihydroxyacetone synthase [Tulasnella sp. JGI-2019a]
MIPGLAISKPMRARSEPIPLLPEVHHALPAHLDILRHRPRRLHPPSARSVLQVCSHTSARDGRFGRIDSYLCYTLVVGTKAVTDSDGSVTCSTCPQGSYSSAGQKSCTACSAGYTSPASATSSSQCTACSLGTYAMTDSSTGAVSCSACPKGTYQSSSGKTTCTSCATGLTTTGTGATSSNQCVPQPTGGLGRRKRSMNCMRGYKKCFHYSGLSGFECVDVARDPESCGGCVAPEGVLQAARTNDDEDYEEATGQDCTAIPGVNTTTCRRGQCVIEKCRKGYAKLRDAGGKEQCIKHVLNTQEF